MLYFSYLTDVDECLGNNGDCEQLCVNSAGSFSCACRPGFYLASERKRCLGKLFVVRIATIQWRI